MKLNGFGVVEQRGNDFVALVTNIEALMHDGPRLLFIRLFCGFTECAEHAENFIGHFIEGGLIALDMKAFCIHCANFKHILAVIANTLSIFGNAHEC